MNGGLKEREQKMIKRLVELENDILYQDLATDGEPEFICLLGVLQVLVSAPHAAVHTRNQKPKEEDEFTGGMARLIGELCGAHVLYARRKSNTDPNYYPNVPYKQALAKIVQLNQIAFVMDLHGAAADRSFGLELGTANKQSCPADLVNSIISTLSEAGFRDNASDRLRRLAINERFSGQGHEDWETITRYVWKKLYLPVVQIEINAHNRIPRRRADATNANQPFEGDAELIADTVRGLAAVIERVAKNFKN
jgi:hypothetical protein